MSPDVGRHDWETTADGAVATGTCHQPSEVAQIVVWSFSEKDTHWYNLVE